MKNQSASCDVIDHKKGLSYLMRYMHNVADYSNFLKNLGERWEILTLLGQMSGAGADMTKTKDGFANLSTKLLDNLAKETIKKLSGEINSKAQVAVDILIRNLFERTADIGFLSTDDDIRHYILSYEKPTTDQSTLAELKKKLIERFEEYTLKYSVYFDIILTDINGNVLVRLDSDIDVKKSKDMFLKEALTTSGDYVESLTKTNLLPDAGKSLLYSYRVVDPSSSKPIGVLTLCFKFEDEMKRIFHELQAGSEWLVLAILDSQGSVIATSDKYQLPIGAELTMALNESYKIIKFAGKNYIAKTCATNGYQGYFGLNWFGHAMIPLENAFDGVAKNMLEKVDEEILHSVMSNPTLFSSDLREIPMQADRIQKELERTVWNGNVKQSSSKRTQNTTFSKALLWEISATGAKTKDVFESSIGNLHETVVSTILGDAMFQASLAIDIMDRNLYERANDCRWWALTTTFREILSRPSIERDEIKTIESILEYINGLYTVYTNIILVDKSNKIIASSQGSDGLKGKYLNDEYVRQILSVKNTNTYSVSPFNKSFLYDNLETYIYGASVLSLSNDDVVGGIFIVFDSKPQFEAMLLDALPRDDKGEILQGSFGLFVDKNKSIISSTSQKYEIGKTIPLSDDFFQNNENGFSNIVKFENDYYAVGIRKSGGYREYKSEQDSYKNDVFALIFIHLGAVSNEKISKTSIKKYKASTVANTKVDSDNSLEIATFYIGTKWLGVKSELVIEAIGAKGLTRVPGSNSMLLGRINYNMRTIDVISLHEDLGHEQKAIAEDSQVVVVKLKNDEKDERRYGIIVDDLGEIPEVSMDRVDLLDSIVGGSDMLGEAIVKPNADHVDQEMLVIIDPTKVLNKLSRRM